MFFELLSPKTTLYPWKAVKAYPSIVCGKGLSFAQGFALLNDVMLYREFWRRMNGFPPDFYEDHKDDIIVKHRKEKKGDKK